MTAIDRSTLGGARDAAFILLGYAGALRIGELAALALDDIESRPDSILLRIRRSKTDRNAAGAKVAVARGKHPDTDPIAALQHWLRLRGTTPGPVSVPLRGGAAGEHGLAPHTFGRLLKAPAKEVGLPNAERITGHPAPGWTRHRGPSCRRPDRAYRRPDPAQGPLSSVRPLHPPRRRP